MISTTNTKVRLVRCPRCLGVLTELAEVPVYKCGGCGAVLQAKKPKNGTVDATSHGSEEDLSVKRKVEQLSDDKEARSNSSFNQLSPVENEPDRNNEARSSTELSCHEDPESSPEARAHIDTDQENHLDHEHNRMDQDQDQDKDQDQDQDQEQEQEQDQEQEQEQDQDQDQDQDQEMYMTDGVSENCKDGAESGEKCSSSEHSFHGVEEPSQVVVKDSSFKSLIAEKLLETRQKKVVMDEDDISSEDETANLSHRRSVRGFERVSSVETLENVRFGNTSYYGYEGSVSSFDGNNENLHWRKNHGGSKGLLKRDELSANNTLNGDSGNGHRAKWHHEFHPHHQRGKATMTRLEKESPSRRRFNDHFHDDSRYRSPVIPESPKLQKFELLKMVQELQDQLDRTTFSNAQQCPSYHVPNYPRYPPRYGQRMAFSGEAATGVYSPCHNCYPQDRHFSGEAATGVYSPCHNCYLQDRHFSAQLPRQAIYHNNGAYCSPRRSGPLSPQHYSGPEFSVLPRNETIPNDHRLPRPYLREKHRSPKKRHVRPIASGAPLIACYRCSETLQMPQSFLLFKRKYHSLRCGACSKVLRFMLVNGSQVIQYYPEEMIAAPPSSEIDDYADSRAPRAEPVSCSDRSFQKSYSTETDNAGRVNSTDRKLSSHGSPVEERKKVVMLNDTLNQYNGPMATMDSALASSSKNLARKKVTSEIEEIEPATSGPPLHRLMGYASPSKVIRG